MACGVLLGSFDPPHDGHIEAIERCLTFLDRVVVVAGSNPRKTHLAVLPVEERVELMKAILPTDRVIVEPLAEDFVAQIRRHDVRVLVQGIRAPEDAVAGWSYLTDMLVKAPEMLTVFVHAPEPLSSTQARELLEQRRYDELRCPPIVVERLKRKREAST